MWPCKQTVKSYRHQSGVALFMALIALLLMSLAAVSMIRSVDTNTQIAGNLSYRQTAVTASTMAQEALADVLGPIPYVKSYDDCTGVHSAYSGCSSSGGNAVMTDTPVGYYATCSHFDGTGSKCTGVKLTDDANWQPGVTSRYATGTGIDSSGKDTYGNTVQYIVERMCTTVGAADNVKCLLDGTPADANSHGGVNKPNTGWPIQANQSPLYRVTVRIDGPKNTVSFVQAFMS